MAKSIRLGDAAARPVSVNLDLLIKTRLLLTASSGGGKSEAIRLLAERAFGKVQVILIDPEGEFCTLREKFGYVLVGENGETPADIRSAELVATKLLELNASAVCDLYEMRPTDRHEWVKRFLSALIDAPKKLWHPVIVVLDEGHYFAPEKGQGESGAFQSVIDLCSRGRKRGYCAVIATQRLSKLSKNAAAELQNIMIGRTTHVDQERAADIFRVKPSEKRAFFARVSTLGDGQFMLLGRAFSRDNVTIQVDRAQTKPPKVGSASAGTVPPAPNSVKKLLPQLADLPKEAESKIKTEADLRAEIRSLRGKLQAAEQSRPQVDVAPLHGEIRRLDNLLKVATAKSRNLNTALTDLAKKSTSSLDHFTDLLTGSETEHFELTIGAKPVSKLPAPVLKPESVWPRPPAKTSERTTESSDGNHTLTGPELRILNAISWMNAIGVDEPSQVAVAFVAGYSPVGGAFINPRGVLVRKGLILKNGANLSLTGEGNTIACTDYAHRHKVSNEELHRMVMERLPGPERRILKCLLDAYPEWLTNEALGQRAGYAPTGGAFINPRGRLRSLELLEYSSATQSSKAADLLFPEIDK